MSHKLPDGVHCPGCGGPVERQHRHAADRLFSIFVSLRRYRCLDAQCGWQGIVGRERAPPPAAPNCRSRLLWALVGAALAVAGMTPILLIGRARPAAKPAPAASVALAHQETAVDQPPPTEAPGVHDEGIELPRSDTRRRNNPTPLDLRFNCIWGIPGRTPYRGSVEDALKATQMLPPEVVRRISEMAENGWTKETVEISRRAIRSVDGRQLFKPEIPAMAFGNTLCFTTRVNFPRGHVEYAALYEAEDRSGKTYSVMVPYVCNNVSVLGVRAEREAAAVAVAEPPAWLIVGTAVGALAWLRRRSTARHA